MNCEDVELELSGGEASVEARLAPDLLPELERRLETIAAAARAEVLAQGIEPAKLSVERHVHLRYEGTDKALVVPYGGAAEIQEHFDQAHKQRFGFVMPGKPLVVEVVANAAVGAMYCADDPGLALWGAGQAPDAKATLTAHMAGKARPTPVYERAALRPGHRIAGPAIILEAGATTVVEPEWQAEVTARVAPGVVFGNFHFPDSGNVNNLTILALDPVAKIPEYKVCAVRVIPANAAPRAAASGASRA